jgi:hypothetical protein
LPVTSETIVQSICAGNNVSGHDTTGTYTEQFTGLNGCDSTITLLLTVNPLPRTPVISANGSQLSIDTTGISSYQWYQDGILIPDADTNEYTISADGAYYVVVANTFGCSSTSDTVQITGVGTPSEKPLDIHIYPNPAKSKVTVSLGTLRGKEVTTIEVFNALGERVLTPLKTKQKEVTLSLEGLSKGLYLVKVTANGQQQTVRLVKE